MPRRPHIVGERDTSLNRIEGKSDGWNEKNLLESPERSKSRSITVRTNKSKYSHSDLDKKKAQAYIYNNFGYDINSDPIFSREDEQEDDELGDTVNTNRLNNSMKDMEDAFHKLNTFTDADLQKKQELRINGRHQRESKISSQVIQTGAVPFKLHQDDVKSGSGSQNESLQRQQKAAKKDPHNK